MYLNMMNSKKMNKKVMKEVLENPNIYDYDAGHDKIRIAREQLEAQKKSKGKAKYMKDRIQAYDKRKREESYV